LLRNNIDRYLRRSGVKSRTGRAASRLLRRERRRQARWRRWRGWLLQRWWQRRCWLLRSSKSLRSSSKRPVCAWTGRLWRWRRQQFKRVQCELCDHNDWRRRWWHRHITAVGVWLCACGLCLQGVPIWRFPWRSERTHFSLDAERLAPGSGIVRHRRRSFTAAIQHCQPHLRKSDAACPVHRQRIYSSIRYRWLWAAWCVMLD
jgi:hypothetical protein